jgi:hypothetical protein
MVLEDEWTSRENIADKSRWEFSWQPEPLLNEQLPEQVVDGTGWYGWRKNLSLTFFYVHVTVHRNIFLCNKTN